MGIIKLYDSETSSMRKLNKRTKQPVLKKITFQVGVNIIGLPLYHTMFVFTDAKKK